MPGVALQRRDQSPEESLYWAQSPSTRSLIRQTFKNAWQYVLRQIIKDFTNTPLERPSADVCPVFAGLENLQWDGPTMGTCELNIYQGPHLFTCIHLPFIS